MIESLHSHGQSEYGNDSADKGTHDPHCHADKSQHVAGVRGTDSSRIQSSGAHLTQVGGPDEPRDQSEQRHSEPQDAQSQHQRTAIAGCWVSRGRCYGCGNRIRGRDAEFTNLQRVELEDRVDLGGLHPVFLLLGSEVTILANSALGNPSVQFVPRDGPVGLIFGRTQQPLDGAGSWGTDVLAR